MNDFRTAILELAVEDDYGLWEVLWRIKTIEPSLPEAEAVEAARKTVTDLYDRGLVELGRRSGCAWEPAPPEEIRELLSTPASWEAPQSIDEGFFIRSTASGDNAHYHP